MPSATLIVQDFSLGFVEQFVRYLHSVLQRNIDPDAQLIVCKEVGEAQHAPGLVFVIGENFRPFRRRKGCTYAFINLSVVTVLGGPFSASLKGHRQIQRKRRMLAAKSHLFDVLLDFYAPQTSALAVHSHVPVLGFDYAVDAPAPDVAPQRIYDVCFVGSMNTRRSRVLEDIASTGASLSPSSGAPIEDIAAQSACCLNIHTERSNHLEVPRIVAALSRGCPVVTERSYGLASLNASEFLTEQPLAKLSEAVTELLSNRNGLCVKSQKSAEWYRDYYLPRAETRWREICGAMADRSLAA